MPIINPADIYWTTRLIALNDLFTVTLVIALVMIPTIFILSLLIESTTDYVVMPWWQKKAKSLIVLVIILAIGMTFTPTKEVAYTIFAAKYVTTDNLSAARDQVLDFVTAINDIVKNDND